MPSSNREIPMSFLRHVHIVSLDDHMSHTEIQKLKKKAVQIQWNQNVPGGFTHNVPQRQVNAFGDGSGYNSCDNIVGHHWSNGYWTAAVHQNDATLITKLQQLPKWLKRLGLLSRHFAKDLIGIQPTDYTYNLAVCNKYTEPSHDIKQHADDNEWYVKDSEQGPTFVSLTLYPTSLPQNDEEHANFQILAGGRWHDIVLPDASLLFMPSCLPHRVKSCRPNQFHQRINITLRSVPSPFEDPVRSLQGVSNHSRYYRLPDKLIVSQDNASGHIESIKEAFNACLRAHGKPKLDVMIRKKATSKPERSKRRKRLVDNLKPYTSCRRFYANTVTELLEECADQVLFWKRMYMSSLSHT